MVCVLITAGPSTKLFAWGGGDVGGHVLRETIALVVEVAASSSKYVRSGRKLKKTVCFG